MTDGGSHLSGVDIERDGRDRSYESEEGNPENDWFHDCAEQTAYFLGRRPLKDGRRYNFLMRGVIKKKAGQSQLREEGPGETAESAALGLNQGHKEARLVMA
ncbi:hypothetical protein KM043_017262 [Ampulex compressa]|nr:hypothetical protein KM043_017262 [Ampulex compressa]